MRFKAEYRSYSLQKGCTSRGSYHLIVCDGMLPNAKNAFRYGAPRIC